MDNHDTEQGKALRRKRLLEIMPKAAPAMMSEHIFQTQYLRYHYVLRDRLTAVEENSNIMFCPACVMSWSSTTDKRRILHFIYEKDPLGNFPLLATGRCHGCGWEEMMPIVIPELDDTQRELIDRYRDTVRTNGPTIRDWVPAHLGPHNMTPEQQEVDALWRTVKERTETLHEYREAVENMDKIEKVESERAMTIQQAKHRAKAAVCKPPSHPSMNMPISAFGQDIANAYLRNTVFSGLLGTQKKGGK